MTDSQTTVAELRANLDKFVAERDWAEFHTPKNLAMALAVEAAELMEHFQWLTAEESCELANEPQRLAPVAEEIADVFGYCLALASELGIDLSTTVRAKMIKNAEKYPVELSRGRAEPPVQDRQDP